MKELNKNHQIRDRIIFGHPLTEDDYCGGCKHFYSLSFEKLSTLLEEGFAYSEEIQNSSPSIAQLHAYAKKCIEKGFNAVFFGYVISPNREDYRTSIDAIEVTGINLDPDVISEFEQLAQSADEIIVNSMQLYAWWD